MSGCPFRLAVINDEITQDFEKACSIAAKDFGLSWIELRGMWNKNITDLNAKEVGEARKILEAHRLRVTDIASPLFKVDWPGAPVSKQSEKRDQFHADFDMTAQDKLLERCIQLAKAFQTDRIRCFDFWRLEDQKPYRAAMDQKLRQAAARCQKDGLILLLENEMSCNTATGAESKRTLAAVTNTNFMLNWDPGNAAAAGEYPASKGFAFLPKSRIGHCHAKDVAVGGEGKHAWAPVGDGVVGWPEQIREFLAMKYHYAISLETHWRGAGTPEASTRISMAGLKKVLAGDGVKC